MDMRKLLLVFVLFLHTGIPPTLAVGQRLSALVQGIAREEVVPVVFPEGEALLEGDLGEVRGGNWRQVVASVVAGVVSNYVTRAVDYVVKKIDEYRRDRPGSDPSPSFYPEPSLKALGKGG